MNDFKEWGLHPHILKAIEELGFEQPTPIQVKTIPAIMEGTRDLIASAQTGTGKTAGFGLPILQQLDPGLANIQALVLSPTRELCMQIAKDLTGFARYMKRVKVVPVYGGASVVNQKKDLKAPCPIVVGTPGRTLDLIRQKALRINDIRYLVLDEADEMLQMGFKEELDAILEETPKEKQTLLFSATMPPDVRKIADNYMNAPEEISVGKKNQGAENVNHIYYVVKSSNRYLALKRLADVHPNIYGIIFCRTRRETKEIADLLIQDGYNADALHGDLSQSQRDFVMQRFRIKALQLLVATDVAARGLDVNDLSHVINYNLPDDDEVYIHRSGRTGRAGKSGTSLTITTIKEARRIKTLQRLCGKPFEYQKVPGGKEICEKRLFNLIDKVEQVEVNEAQVASFLPPIIQKLERFERDALIKRFVSVEFNRFLDYYRNAGDINVDSSSSDKKDGRKKKDKTGSRAFTRFYINIGYKHKISVPEFIGLINDTTRTKNIALGKIDILRKFSFFEVDKQYADKVLRSFKDAYFHDLALEVQPAAAEQGVDRRTDMTGVKKKKKKEKNMWSKNRNKKFGTGKFMKGKRYKGKGGA